MVDEVNSMVFFRLILYPFQPLETNDTFWETKPFHFFNTTDGKSIFKSIFHDVLPDPSYGWCRLIFFSLLTHLNKKIHRNVKKSTRGYGVKCFQFTEAISVSSATLSLFMMLWNMRILLVSQPQIKLQTRVEIEIPHSGYCAEGFLRLLARRRVKG